jgi:hypothetical protein
MIWVSRVTGFVLLGLLALAALSCGAVNQGLDAAPQPAERNASGLLTGALDLTSATAGAVQPGLPLHSAVTFTTPFSELFSAIAAALPEVEIDKVRVYLDNGRRMDFKDLTGRRVAPLPRGASVLYVEVRGKDGGKWYFDGAGNLLPCAAKWYTDVD